jgi:hypothetical protein
MASLSEPESACNNIMEKKVDEFLGDLNEAEVILPFESEELFPEKEEEVKEKEEKIPFHKDEKLQRYIDKQVEKRLNKTTEQTFTKEVSQGEPKFISSLEKIIGNDTPEKLQALKDLKDDWAGMSKQAKQEAVNSLIEAQQENEQKEQEELAEALDELDEGREEIESHIGKPLTEKQWDAYKDYLSDIEPRGGYEQYPDFIKTFDYFKKSVSRSNDQAKSLASRGMERSVTTTTEQPKAGSWKDWNSIKEKILN